MHLKSNNWDLSIMDHYVQSATLVLSPLCEYKLCLMNYYNSFLQPKNNYTWKLYHISNSIWITYIVHIWFVRFISLITMGMKKSFNRMMAEVTECHIVAYATVTLDKIVLLYLFLLRRLKVSPFEITTISIIFIYM